MRLVDCAAHDAPGAHDVFEEGRRQPQRLLGGHVQDVDAPGSRLALDGAAERKARVREGPGGRGQSSQRSRAPVLLRARQIVRVHAAGAEREHLREGGGASVTSRPPHAPPRQARLVLHQADERRHDDANLLGQEGRELVAAKERELVTSRAPRAARPHDARRRTTATCRSRWP